MSPSSKPRKSLSTSFLFMILRTSYFVFLWLVHIFTTFLIVHKLLRVKSVMDCTLHRASYNIQCSASAQLVNVDSTWLSRKVFVHEIAENIHPSLSFPVPLLCFSKLGSETTEDLALHEVFHGHQVESRLFSDTNPCIQHPNYLNHILILVVRYLVWLVTIFMCINPLHSRPSTPRQQESHFIYFRIILYLVINHCQSQALFHICPFYFVLEVSKASRILSGT